MSWQTRGTMQRDDLHPRVDMRKNMFLIMHDFLEARGWLLDEHVQLTCARRTAEEKHVQAQKMTFSQPDAAPRMWF